MSSASVVPFPKWATIFMGAITVLILLVFILFSGRSGFTYVVQYRVNSTIDGWQHAQKTEIMMDEWKEMDASIEQALAFDAGNPDLYHARGRLYLYRGSYMNSSRQQSILFMQQAMDNYREVIRLRPVWPYGHLNLAIAKARVGQFDVEFSQTLARLIEVAAWEKNTLSDIVGLAIFAWPYLDRETRESIQGYLLLASKKRQGEVYHILNEAGLMDRFCSIPLQKKESPLCL